MKFSFTILGQPVAQGNLKAFTPKGWNRPVLTHSNAKDLKPWRQQIAEKARDEMAKACEGVCDPFDREVAICLYLHFCVTRPKSTSKKVTHVTTRPDLDKYARCVFDALTGTVYVDDSQICRAVLSKSYGNPSVEITVETLEGEARIEPSETLSLFSQNGFKRRKTELLEAR